MSSLASELTSSNAGGAADFSAGCMTLAIMPEMTEIAYLQAARVLHLAVLQAVEIK
jgi:hypothetical protein